MPSEPRCFQLFSPIFRMGQERWEVTAGDGILQSEGYLAGLSCKLMGFQLKLKVIHQIRSDHDPPTSKTTQGIRTPESIKDSMWCPRLSSWPKPISQLSQRTAAPPCSALAPSSLECMGCLNNNFIYRHIIIIYNIEREADVVLRLKRTNPSQRQFLSIGN